MRRIFSNTKSSDNLPNQGKESASVEFLLKFTDVPFESDEMLGLEAIFHLFSWDWGIRSFFDNPSAADYLLTRTQRAQSILLQKFENVKKALATAAKTEGMNK